MEETEKWRDGVDMVCSICTEPILRGQARYATTSHAIKKRSAQHFTCAGGKVWVIGPREISESKP